MSEWGLILPFDRQSEDFVFGFECGRLYTALENSDMPLEATVHVENSEMMMRLAEATSRTVQSRELGDGWMTVSFSARLELS